MACQILPLLIAVTFGTTPSVNLNAKAQDPVSCLKTDGALIFIADDPKPPADRTGPADGLDPHGADPHDEQHDPGLPANRDRDSNKAPQGPYGDPLPGGRAPY